MIHLWVCHRENISSSAVPPPVFQVEWGYRAAAPQEYNRRTTYLQQGHTAIEKNGATTSNERKTREKAKAMGTESRTRTVAKSRGRSKCGNEMQLSSSETRANAVRC